MYRGTNISNKNLLDWYEYIYQIYFVGRKKGKEVNSLALLELSESQHARNYFLIECNVFNSYWVYN